MVEIESITQRTQKPDMDPRAVMANLWGACLSGLFATLKALKYSPSLPESHASHGHDSHRHTQKCILVIPRKLPSQSS